MKIITATDHKAANEADALRVGLAQISPILLNRAATLEKVNAAIAAAAMEGAQLVSFGESLVPGYPFWVERTGGAQFNSPKQKKYYADYLDQGVMIERGDLVSVCENAKKNNIAVYLGIMERAADRGGHTLYASLVYINQNGEI